MLSPESQSEAQTSLTKPSATATALMKLSDWVLLAKTGEAVIKPTILEEIYHQLTSILAKEGITLLEADGLCDYEQQMVVGTQTTDDPARTDHVCSTLRPGFLFHGRLLRPQEIIVYTLESE
jgi:molecular chaperone GrpE (heat shock protein)